MSRKRSNSAPVLSKKRSRTYANLDSKEKEMAAAFAYQLRLRNMKTSEILSILEDAGYSVTKSTLNRWLALLEKGESILSSDKKAGAQRLLRPDQLVVLVGYVLSENIAKKIVSRSSVLASVKAHFDISPDLTTIGKWLREAGFSVRTGKRTYTSAKNKNVSLEEMLATWIRSQRLTGNFNDLFGHIDFTYTSHRVIILSTYSPTGMLGV